MLGRMLVRVAYGRFSGPLVLGYKSHIGNYTFLGASVGLDKMHMLRETLGTDKGKLTEVLGLWQKHEKILLNLSKETLSFKEVSALGNKRVTSLFGHDVTGLPQLGQKYEQLYQQILTTASAQNFIVWMQVVSSLNIMDMAVWNRLLSLVINNFQQITLEEQHRVIVIIGKLVKNGVSSYDNKGNGFVYKQNFLKDFSNFKQLFYCFLNHLTRDQQASNLTLKSQSLEWILTMLEKVKRVLVLNTNTMSQMIIDKQSHYFAMSQEGTLTTSLKLLNLISLAGLYQQDMIEHFQRRIIDCWEEEKDSLSQFDKIQITSTIFSSWGYFHRSNQQLYSLILRPFIEHYLSHSQKDHYFSQWLHKMIRTPLDDPPLFQQLLRRASRNPIENRYLHVVEHFLAIKYGIEGMSAYQKCTQNLVTREIVEQHGRAYSPCMLRGDRQPTTQLRGKKQGGALQSHKPETFWQSLFERAFKQLSPLYPHSSNAIYFNLDFCVFEIDAIISLNNKWIALQLVGTQYTTKSAQLHTRQHRKLLRQRIIKAYGVHFVYVNSDSLQQRTIASFRNIPQGTDYLIDRIKAVLTQ